MEQQPERQEAERGMIGRAYPQQNHSPNKGRPTVRRANLLSMAFLVLVSGAAGYAGGWLGTRNDGTKVDIQKQQVVLKTQGQLLSDIASRVGKSVVSVETTAQTTSLGFFGQPTSSEESGAGTGMIIDKSGLIMTNRHVVPQGTTKVAVVLSDGTRFDNVTVLGRTSENDTLDVAFLKIQDLKGKELTAVTLGDSSKADIGDTVVAIGNALGQFQNTVTSGIISGYGRKVTAGDSNGSSAENLENLIQTDTAINPGNSGGPLVNLDGEVIGMNTAVANAENIGFAIPLNDLKGSITSVMQTGKLERPFLGVVYIPITADMAKQYSLSVDHGAYIPPSITLGRKAIVDNSPAAKAGLKEGDIITKVGNESVDEKHSLTSLLGKHGVGDKVTITIVRDGKEKNVDVTLGAAPDQTQQ